MFLIFMKHTFIYLSLFSHVHMHSHFWLICNFKSIRLNSAFCVLAMTSIFGWMLLVKIHIAVVQYEIMLANIFIIPLLELVNSECISILISLFILNFVEQCCVNHLCILRSYLVWFSSCITHQRLIIVSFLVFRTLLTVLYNVAATKPGCTLPVEFETQVKHE